MTAGSMTKGQVAAWGFLHARLPDYAQDRLVPSPDWEWLATCPMLSSGESAVVTLAAHLWDVPWVVVQDPRSLRALLGAVSHDVRVAWALALREVGEEMAR